MAGLDRLVPTDGHLPGQCSQSEVVSEASDVAGRLLGLNLLQVTSGVADLGILGSRPVRASRWNRRVNFESLPWRAGDPNPKLLKSSSGGIDHAPRISDRRTSGCCRKQP